MERDLIGYGPNPPKGRWPNGARVALSICLNYEEGSERSWAMGDADQETLSEVGNYPMPAGIRNLAMESMFEYGSRVGIWRILDLLGKYQAKVSVYGCAVSFEQNPEVAKAAVAAGHEIVCHGYRWEEVFRLTEAEEREHIRLAVASIEATCGQRPSGWYCRYGPSINTRRLLVEEGGFLYDSDAYNDDIPYFVQVGEKQHLVLPYSHDVNDFRFWITPGFTHDDDFFRYGKAALDRLHAEGELRPLMMSVGLHPRIIGRPARIGGLEQLLEYAQSRPDVWIATRREIAEAWVEMTR